MARSVLDAPFAAAPGSKAPQTISLPQPARPSAGDASGRRRRHRTIFISDTHLGTRGCKAEALADFLAHNECDTLFLVGDIVDGWQLKRRWYWNEAQSQVVAEILRKVDRRHAGDLRARQS